MFKIESYVTPILLSYVDKYVRDFKPADAQVSLWEGGVALHNLVLKADVLQQEVSLPFTLVSGRIHELLIQVPWTKIMSEPIIVTIDTIECVLTLNPPPPDGSQPPESPSRKTQVVEAPPGYMQALVRRIVSNIALRVHHLIVKYVQDDIVMSLNVKHLAVDSAGANWEPAFADIDQSYPVIRRLVRLDNLTLCLDRADSDGKIRYYQEPLLYRCQLDLRVLTKLVSANTRRASSLSVQLRTSKLAFSVTEDQLMLLLRLLRERASMELKQPPPPAKAASVTNTTPLHGTASSSAEPTRRESWSEWAWSWLPTWIDREGGFEEAPVPATPTPIFFAAYLDDISIAFKVMDIEGSTRKRARAVLEFNAYHAAVKSSICSPTMLRVRFGTRLIKLCSHGKCVCGHLDHCGIHHKPTIYLSKVKEESDEEWNWPEEDFSEQKVEAAQAVDEEFRESPDLIAPSEYHLHQQSERSEIRVEEPEQWRQKVDDIEEPWRKMEPVLYIEYTHDRTPSNPYTNPYENPPLDFQYSDWVEVCNMKIDVAPMQLQVSMGLLHRLQLISNIYKELPPVTNPGLMMRTLTVEECDALSENIPQRRIVLEILGFRVRLLPWDHSLQEMAIQPPLVLDIDLPKSTLTLNGPLYPHRVCSAACQMPADSGPLWQGARLHVSFVITSIQIHINLPDESQPRTCARADLRIVTHILLNKEYFGRRETVEFAYSLKFREANLSGSAPRLQAAYQVVQSLINNRPSVPLRYTTLARDALNDDESVAIDITLEEAAVRGYITKFTNTHIMSMQSAKGTNIHANKEEMKQAWIFSAPEASTTTPYLRLAVQWCSQPFPNSLDYMGAWTEPIAFAIDPLFIAWLAYKPTVKPTRESSYSITSLGKASQYFMRRRATPPSSSSRSKSRSGAELVHGRPRSGDSSSEPSEKKEYKLSQPQEKTPDIWTSDRMLKLHERMRQMLMNVELGLIMAYVTEKTASALDCATIRDAMERHAGDANSVLALSLGRMSMHSSSVTKHLWQDIRHDGPTFVTKSPERQQTPEENDSFPWKMRVADMSCYTLECARAKQLNRDKSSSGLRSQIRVTGINPRTVLEHITTTVTLSVVTKSMQIKTAVKTEKKRQTEVTPEEVKTKYFTTGVEFRPTTLKEFVRGPATRRRKSGPEVQSKATPVSAHTVTSGPVISLGVHVHADTPPIVVRIDHDQIQIMATAIHCVQHIVTLMQRSQMTTPRQLPTLSSSHRLLNRSVSEMEELHSQSEDTPSENRSELISIFEAQSVREMHKLKTFYWFQWVVSRATLVASTSKIKLTFDIDDIITTVDLQDHYNQLKVKLASASVRHYERAGSTEWIAGELGGRVLEAREPTNAKEENHFLAITITQAQISNLPASWKEELNPKIFERNAGIDTMWEVYATIAPLEAVLHPIILEHFVSFMKNMAPQSSCPLENVVQQRPMNWEWPFCYLTAGGLRLLVSSDQENEKDDTFILAVGKVTINPHPENPVCRRTINSMEGGWSSNNEAYEGRQYEVLVKNVGVRSAQFKQIVNEELIETETMKGGQENPALKWNRRQDMPIITPVLHSVDVGCVLAPALYVGGVMTCGPAVELNLMSDCTVEISIDQIALAKNIISDMYEALLEANDSVMLDKNKGLCPYADLILNQDRVGDSLSSTLSDGMLVNVIMPEPAKILNDAAQSPAPDSGVDTMTTHSNKSIRQNQETSIQIKKSVSVVFVEQIVDPVDYLEVFVTMGMIEISLYICDDGSPEIVALRPPVTMTSMNTEPVLQIILEESKEPEKPLKPDEQSIATSRSLTETVRKQDIGKSQLEIVNVMPQARKCEGNIALAHITLHQPNLYYWRKKSTKNLQVSLFNIWVGLGMGLMDGHWNAVLLTTAKGVPDPVTDIPPALATMKVVVPCGGTASSTANARGTIQLDVERPVLVEICCDRLRRIKAILSLLDDAMATSREDLVTQTVQTPIFYQFRRFMEKHLMESVTIQTSQIGLVGSEGSIGCESMSLQLASGPRPQRVVGRALVSALVVSTGPPGDIRHVLVHPMYLGVELEATWEAWRRAESGMAAYEPTVRLLIDVDRIVIDVRPSDLASLKNILESIGRVQGKKNTYTQHQNSKMAKSAEKIYKIHSAIKASSKPEAHFSTSSLESDLGDHYYKDDLRSGAFKIVSGGQLPMAYQVMVYGNSVSWRYPHPRAVTRIVAFPLPGQDKEIDCVLELYSPLMNKWMSHTFFKLPVSEPREMKLYVAPPDGVFATLWRFRTYSESTEKTRPSEFNIQNYVPRQDPLFYDTSPDVKAPPSVSGVTAEQLSGVLRVDSYFAPRLLPRLRVSCRMSGFELHAHNSLPFLSSQATALEGYYVSRPLMRSHRVLTVHARDVTAISHLGSSAGKLTAMDATISADLLDSTTGAIEEVVEEFRVRAAMSVAADNSVAPRVRCRASRVHAALHVQRMRTMHALVKDWELAVDHFLGKKIWLTPEMIDSPNFLTKRELAIATAATLDGRVSLWIHNSCASALRVGQEGTDEVVPLGPGARLAYRWRSPTATKRLRIALANPSTDWHWSSSVAFTGGCTRVRLEDDANTSKSSPGAGVFVHVRVEEVGARRSMHISGRLTLANMLRHNLLYKVRYRCPSSNQWRSNVSGELLAESVGRSVICDADCEMVLKIKFATHDTGWSGDIPLKECPKENVPWLVKVPSDGEVPYMSVWCRVVRARSDGRILATVWPLYVLHSHLPLDTDVMIVTHTEMSTADLTAEHSRSPPLIQTATGRGTSTHLVPPGTTAARHSLSFQYRNIDCPVTREAVPLHYGVMDTSVFEKSAPVQNIDEVIQEVLAWMHRSSRGATSSWPYSAVTHHWPSEWQPTLLQPRCDVTVRYRAVRAGGGCSLEVQLCPLVLLCNASPIALTLRAHDAAPLCKLEPGSALSPPSAILTKPFFLSVEMGRETFVSEPLQISSQEPGRYGEPSPGHLSIDHSADFAIQCNQKVALLTMYYEIKEEINVLGVSSTYVLINQLNTVILVSPIVMPSEQESITVLRPKTYKVVTPTQEGSINGTPLCRFSLRERWRGGHPSELLVYICVALPSGRVSSPSAVAFPARPPIPVQLGNGSPYTRRPIALIDSNNKSIPVVVTQVKQGGRWLVTVSPDPCPQFVVNNRTRTQLMVAQPVQFTDEPSTSYIRTVPECEKLRWWCQVHPGSLTHYSTPAHCARFPPPNTNVAPSLPFLTFATWKGENFQPDWCQPVAVADGEQLLQLHDGLTLKLRVHTHPHSTLLELQDVDMHDISASDIRRRLLGNVSETSMLSLKESSCQLERIGADEKLLNKSIHSEELSISWVEPDTATLTSFTVPVGVPEKPEIPEKKGTQQTRLPVEMPLDNHAKIEVLDDTEIDVLKEQNPKNLEQMDLNRLGDEESSKTSLILHDIKPTDWEDGDYFPQREHFKCVFDAFVVEISASEDTKPLLALHAERVAVHVLSDKKRIKTALSIADVQIDNLQYDTGQYDFPVVASTRNAPVARDRWPPMWNMFADREAFEARRDDARVLLVLQHDKWTIVDEKYNELTEVEIAVGPISLYVEDAYVSALVALWKVALPASPPTEMALALADVRSLQRPLRLRSLLIHPLDLTLTLHTAVRMYIALDQSPLRLTEFRLQDMMTSAERLTHALTVHYLSAAILGAGWVVGGLELLGAPGALAARVGGATGGVRGVASAAAAALLRSLSAWAGSLARNLDLLAGDEEHIRRAAAARRRPPPSLVAGLIAGITNFAINILGAVGGLAHHPLVGVAVGETESGAAALRRGLLGALTKPLSATADLVAFAGHGLLTQTGWDPVPQPRAITTNRSVKEGWRLDCVRWTFRLAELTVINGFEVLLDNAALELLITHKFLVVADPESERIVEMIDFRFCTLGPYKGQIIELCVTQRRGTKVTESRAVDEDDEYQITAAAMARVARYTGADAASSTNVSGEARVLALLPAPGRSYALHAALNAAIHHNAESHFALL